MRIGSRRLFIGVIRDLSSRQEIEQLKTGFVSTVSHELRTPLTSISGSLGLLAGGIAGALPAKAARLIDIAKLNCERLVRLINDILDLERSESGRLELRLAAQRLKPIVRHAIDANRAYAQTFGAIDRAGRRQRRCQRARRSRSVDPGADQHPVECCEILAARRCRVGGDPRRGRQCARHCARSRSGHRARVPAPHLSAFRAGR